MNTAYIYLKLPKFDVYLVLNMRNQIRETKNFGALIDKTIKQIKANYLKTFKQLNVNITTEQWMIIDCLAEKNTQTQTELAENSFKNKPTVSRILNLLERKKMIERTPVKSDMRKFHIQLTEFGQQTHQKLLPEVEALRHKGWDGLNNEDYNNLERILNVIFKNFD